MKQVLFGLSLVVVALCLSPTIRDLENLRRDVENFQPNLDDESHASFADVSTRKDAPREDQPCVSQGGECRPNANSVCQARLIKRGLCGGDAQRQCCFPAGGAKNVKYPRKAADDKTIEKPRESATPFVTAKPTPKPPVPGPDSSSTSGSGSSSGSGGNSSDDGGNPKLPRFSEAMKAYEKTMMKPDPKDPEYLVVLPTDELKKKVGGGIDSDDIKNSCAIRVSRILNYAGHPLPSGLRGLYTRRGGDGKNYALRVAELSPYFERTFGRPTFVAPSTDKAKFMGKKGIIRFTQCDFSDATGHFDLWDGANAVMHAYWDRCKLVALWQMRK